MHSFVPLGEREFGQERSYLRRSNLAPDVSMLIPLIQYTDTNLRRDERGKRSASNKAHDEDLSDKKKSNLIGDSSS